MKTILITLIVATLVAITALKEDTAEALFHTFIFGCVMGFAALCAWVEAKMRLNRFKRIREDNRLRRAEILDRVMVIDSLAEEVELVGN